MDLSYLFSLIAKRKWYILLPALLAGSLTYYFVQNLPKKFRSAATLSTGIVDFKGITVGKENTFVQQFQIESRFSNLIEDLGSRPSIKLMSHKLLMHDLTNSSKAFHTPKWEKSTLYDEATLKRFAKDYSTFSAENPDLRDTFYNSSKALELERVYGYDYQSLIEKMEIKRVGETDFVRVDFVSDRPDLSYYAVSNYINDFLVEHYNQENSVETTSVQFYSELAQQKKIYLDSLVDVLNAFKQNRLLVNLEDQGKAVVTQLRELELSREQEKKSISGLDAAVNHLDNEIGRVNKDINNQAYATNVFLKSDVQELGNQIQALNEQYVTTGMKDESLRRRAEELRVKREQLAKQYALAKRDPDDIMGGVAKDWVKDKVELENKRVIASEAVRSLDKEINRLRNLKSSLVSSNSYVGNLEQEVMLSQDDYTATIQKLEQAKLNYQDQEKPMRMSEPPLEAQKPESSKAVMLSVFAGVATAILSMIFIIILAFMDSSLNNPYQFRKFTKLPLLSVVNRLPNKMKDLNFIFGSNVENREAEYFKETLRKLRLQVEESHGKVFLFTSMKPQEGKSFLIVSLAYTLGLKDKKVLIIDTNFKNNTLTLFANGNAYGQPLNDDKGFVLAPDGKVKGTGLSINAKLYNVDIIGNKQGNQSPSEILGGTNFTKQLESFKDRYDYIFLEAAHLNRYTDTRELAAFADKIIPVFDAESRLTSIDEEGLQYLHSLNGKMMGAVLNSVSLRMVHNN